MDTKSTYLQALTLDTILDDQREKLEEFIHNEQVLTKAEGNASHVNVFFLPYDKAAGKIYLGHHKKADDWISPGGHIEKGETPVEAVLREFREELNFEIKEDQLELSSLSYKYIGRPDKGCLEHYDIWYLVHVPSSIDFIYDPKEYYDASWFLILDGLQKITKNQDFATIIKRILLDKQ